MKVLAYKLWTEPAVALAVGAAVVLALFEQFAGDGLTVSDLPTIAAFPVVGVGIRQLVSPDERGDVAPPENLPRPTPQELRGQEVEG